MLSQQEPDEHIELLLRQHGFTNLSWIIMAFLGIISPFILFMFDGLLTRALAQIPGDIIIASIILWYMLVMAFILEKYLYWYFNIFIITNLHITDIAMSSLLSKTSTEALLEDVQSVKTKVAGIFGSLFNFGDVIIVTAAEKQEILFSLVPSPDFVADRIEDLQEFIQPGGQHVA